MKKPSETKKRIIAAASNLFRRKGYYGTGLSEILKESGAPKGSFYFHFPDGKDQLTTATIDAAAEDTERLLDTISAQADGLTDFIDRVVSSYGRLLERSDFKASSLFANTALDIAPTNDRVTEHLRAGYRRWHRSIANYCGDQLGSRQKGADMAVLIIASLEGALSLCRAEKSTAPLDAVARQLKQTALNAGQNDSNAVR